MPQAVNDELYSNALSQFSPQQAPNFGFTSYVRFYTCADTTTAGQVCYIDLTNTAHLARADSAVNCSGILGISYGGISGQQATFLCLGYWNNALGFIVGQPVYLSDTVWGGLQQNAPTNPNSVIRSVGYTPSYGILSFNLGGLGVMPGPTGDTGSDGPNTVTTSTTTPITGLLAGNGTTVYRAVANTDYTNPSGLATALTAYTPTSSLGSAAFQPTTAFDASGAAATAQSNAITTSEAYTNTQLVNYALLSGATFSGAISATNFSGSSSGTNTGDQNLSGLVPYTGASSDVNLGSHNLTTTGTDTAGNLNVTGTLASGLPLPTITGLTTVATTGSGYFSPFYVEVYGYKTINGQKLFSITPAQATCTFSATKNIIISWTGAVAGSVDGYRIFANTGLGYGNSTNYLDVAYGTNTFTARSPGGLIGNFVADFPGNAIQSQLPSNQFSNSGNIQESLSAIYSNSLLLSAPIINLGGTLNTLNQNTYGNINIFGGSLYNNGNQMLFYTLSNNIGGNPDGAVLTTVTNTTASNGYNLFIAPSSVFSNWTGSGNTIIGAGGASNGTYLTSGNGNTLIGAQTYLGGTINNSIALGNAANPLLSNCFVVGSSSINGSYITRAYLGSGITDSTPQSITINATGGLGTNITGANLTLAGGASTGSATSGVVNIATTTVGSSGTTAQTLTNRLIISGTKITAQLPFFPVQAPTASAPTYVLGGMYFDTTLNKLRIGGATAWETVTSI